jgi:hypothetical protein
MGKPYVLYFFKERFLEIAAGYWPFTPPPPPPRLLLLLPVILLFLSCSAGGTSLSFYTAAWLRIVDMDSAGKTVTFAWDEGYGDGDFSYQLYRSLAPFADDFTGEDSLTEGWITGNSFIWDYSGLAFDPDNGTHYFGLQAQDTEGGIHDYPWAVIANDAYAPVDGTGTYVKTFDQNIGQVCYNVLGAGNKNIYYLYSNTNTGNSSAPEIHASFSRFNGSVQNRQTLSRSGSTGRGSPAVPAFGIKDKPEALKWNAPAPEKARSFPGLRSVSPPSRSVIAPDQPDNNKLFYLEDNTTITVTAKLRKAYGLDTAGNVNDTNPAVVLNIYTANNDAYGSTTKIKDTMIDALADKFLKPGAGNDIYDWVTWIFGAPWGIHDYDNLIPGIATPAITILLVDIDDDMGDTSGGYTMGYFWEKDNYLASNLPYSNGRLMFYIDAPLFAKGEGTWDITDPYPSEQVSTLAHEFQHMIHYYQKAVLRNTESETWLNEMCSLVAEDLVADKLEIPGPRGIGQAGSSFIYTEGTASSVTDTNRITYFNWCADFSLTDWDDNGSTYSIAYAFGAYLARNYGGAQLFREIVRSSYGGMDAVIGAIDSLNGIDPAPNTGDLLTRWGTAVLLSDKTLDASVSTNYTNYRLNLAGGIPVGSFKSTVAGKDYLLGSINHFIYDDGPFLWGTSKYPSPAVLESVSNTYVWAGKTTGKFSKIINLPPGVRLTVVIKE